MRRRVLLPIICFVLCAPLLRGDDRASLRFIVRHNPVPDAAAPPPEAAPFPRHTNELALAGESLVRLYQTFISPMDAPSCPFTPTCSEYARQAVEQYGLVVGMIKAADRYQRCNGLGTRLYPREEGTQRLVDPP